MDYQFSQIVDILKGVVLKQHNSKLMINQLLVDSRKLVSAPETLFFALKGKRLKGIDFIAPLYEKGVRAFVVEEDIDVSAWDEINIIKVNSCIKSLQALVAFHRRQFDIPIIGITGSNGKTIIKEWLYQLLQNHYHIIRNPKSYNSQLGVPLSVWKIEKQHTLGIFEAGISEPDEMDNLESIIKPTIGIFSSIGEAHSEGFMNMKQKVREKLKLFKNSDIIIYCADTIDIHSNVVEVQHQVNEFGKIEKFKSFTWGHKEEANIRVLSIQSNSKGSQIELSDREHSYHIALPFSDKASIENAIHCVVLMIYLQIPKTVIEAQIQLLNPIAMRLEMKEGIHNSIIINDSYNSDINSLKIAIDFLNQQANNSNKTLILSDILQSGRVDRDLYDEVAKTLAQNKITKLYAIGPNLLINQNSFQLTHLKTRFFSTTEDFLKQMEVDDFKDQSILIKGARKFAFERISKMLERRVHETLMEINLNAIAHNLNIYHSMLKPNTKIMVMIKAFSYGSGSFEIAKLLEHQKVDYLAVAYIDEGVELRKAAINLPILVLNPEISNFDLMIKYQLEPEIYSLHILQQYIKTIAELNEENKSYPIHIKLDTGMHRLGFEAKDIAQLLYILNENPQLKVLSIFSHLAASDGIEHDDFTHQQMQSFESMSKTIMDNFNYPILRHILNSTGITRFKEYQYDMVRLGIGIYGIDSSERIQDLLQEVGVLKTTISQIKHIAKGESIGYSRKGMAHRDTKIATVGIGYADGLNRKLSNGVGYMMVNGTKAPIIGNICMDMTMLDITDIEDVHEGDTAIVFGKEIPIQYVAQAIGTIPYEVLTGISQRVKRVYCQE